MTREADPAAAPRRVRRRGRGRRRSPRRWAVALALGLVPPALGGAFALWRWRSPGPAAGAPFPAPALAAADALGCIPAGALLVATVDVGAVRRAGLADRLWGPGREIAGLGPVREICGADPMDRVETLALGVPAAGDAPDFAVAAAGRLDSEQLLVCAEKIIRSRGGEPVRSPLGGFVAVRDGRAGLGAPELAVRPGGPPLLAAGAYLRVCVDAAEGRIPSARQSVEHALLRREVGEGALVATIVPTVEQRQGLLEELDARGATGSPLGAVRAASLGVELGDPLRGRAVVRCDRPGACAELAALLDRARAAGSGDGAPDAALGPLLGAMQLAATADALQITATLPAQEAVQLATRLLGGAPGR